MEDVLASAASIPARARRIPGHATPLVGRSFVLEQVDNAVAQNFAVALWGPPGVGKSRLAHAFATRWFDARSDGDAWVVDLGDAHDIDEAIASIASALSLPTTGGSDAARDHIGRMLARSRSTLLILDHAERFSDAVAAWVEAWRQHQPRGRVVVTSRNAIDGVHALAVPPLKEDEALRLIEQRARRVRDSFRVDPATRDDLRQLVRRVDALPAALELLAARLLLLSPANLLDRLDAGPGPLHAAMQQSWDLLDEPHRNLLLQLAVTRGGFSVELAERFVDSELDVLDALEQLTQQAWLHVTDGDEVRLAILHEPHRFLRTMPVPDSATDAHAAALVELGEMWDAGIETDDERRCTQRLVDNIPNFWAAWEHVSAPSDRARLGLVLHMALQRGGAAERQDEVSRATLAAAHDSGDGVLHARALLARARVLRWLGDLDGSMQALETSLDSGDAATRCSALRNLAAGAFATGDLDATRRWADRALQTALDEGTAEDEINARNGLGFLLSMTDELDEAREHLERALDLAQVPGRPTGIIALVSSSLAGLCARLELWLDSERHSSRAIAIYEDLGYRRQLPLELLYRAEARLAAGRHAAAQDDIAAADAIARRWAFDALSLRALYLQGVAAIATGEPAAAIEALDLAAARLADRGDRQLATEVAIAAATARLLAGDNDTVTPLLADVDDDIARHLEARARGEQPTPIDSIHPLRQVCLRALGDRRRTLAVDADGRGFQFDDSEHVDLTRRKALRGILQALARRHGGEPLSLDEILEAGWPGEMTTVESGNRRVYVTIKRLRDLGLADVLLTVGDGYMLDPEVEVTRSAPTEQ